jgi:hypothetical protein
VSHHTRATCPRCRRRPLVLGSLRLRVHEVTTPDGERERCDGSLLPVDVHEINVAGVDFRPNEEGAASGC